MASIAELSALTGSQEDFEALLNEELAAGNISEEVADALFSAFTPEEGSYNALFESDPAADVLALESYADSIKPEPTFLEKLQQEELAAVSAAANGTAPMPPMEVLRNRAAIGRDVPVIGMTQDELLAENSIVAREELARRKELQEQGFFESLSNPYGAARAFGAIGKGISQVANLPEGLASFALMGGEYVTGMDLGAEEFVDRYTAKQRLIERNLGLAGTLTPIESLAESLPAAAVPGGLLVKAGAVGTDFLADQAVRELTDDVGESYETVFDKIGITDNNSRPVLGTLGALGAVMLGGSITAATVSRLSRSKLAKPLLRNLTDLDPHAPKNLKTAERASDLTKTYVVDEQQALRDVIRRQGVPNMEDIDARIEFDTHTAARTRTQEAIATGKLKTADAAFDSPIAPKALYDAYKSLNGPTRDQIARYINLKDMRDDIVLAIEKGQASRVDLTSIDNQIATIRAKVPQAELFSTRYNSVTSALRDFAEGSLFSPEYRRRLDKTRHNYVPLELSEVDPNAPFLQQLYQSQDASMGARNQEWFLQNRESFGKYDVSRRADPFDMLLQSVEATLQSRMKNDTKNAIVDGLLQSDIGKQTIRRATAEEAEGNADRLVRLYRNGEPETYITSRLTADLMKFDPYIAKHPWMFIPKRVFEQTAVGPLSITFAPVTALRDAIGGRVLRAAGTNAPNPLEVATAIPQQLYAKAQGAISNAFQQSFVNGNAPLPEWLMSPEKQKHFSDVVSQAYTQSIYHQANTAGGFDASLMKNRIELGEGMLKRTAEKLDKGLSDVTIPGVTFSAKRVRNMVNGFTNIFNAIQDAPRFAAIQRNVRDGMDIEAATRAARQLTGDVTKSGRVYNPQGRRIQVDAVDQGLLNAANKTIGTITEGVRESTPFVNPMIQGARRLTNAVIEDPIGFNLRAWKNIGLPSLVMFGWNEMLGKEYNDYAMNERSARDVVMNQYFGIPGLPPEQGIEIPMMHELLTFSAPFTRGLYGMARGENEERTRAAWSIIAENILSNSLEVGFPTVGQAMFNLAGVNAPETILDPARGIYRIREDELGVLPSNLEQLARTLFTSVGDTAVNVANALAGDMSLETMTEEMKNSVLGRTPIVKNVTGRKRANTYFSIPSALEEERYNALSTFREYYNAYYEPKRLNEDDLQKPASKKSYTKLRGETQLEDADLPFLMIGPEQLQEVTNPLYEEFGQRIVDDVFRGNQGMTGLNDRERTYAKYAKRLRNFNAGDKDALREWQAMLNDIIPEEEGTRQLQELLMEGGYDLSNYDDRVKLINEIEGRRAEIINTQLDVIERLEDDLTIILQEQGRLAPDQRFSVMKHLDPHDPAPLQ